MLDEISEKAAQTHPFVGWEISADEIEVCQRPDGSKWLLGEGRFGQVFKAHKGGMQVRSCPAFACTATLRPCLTFLHGFGLVPRQPWPHTLEGSSCPMPCCRSWLEALLEWVHFLPPYGCCSRRAGA